MNYLICFLLLFISVASTEAKPIIVSSKNFTESYLLGEMLAQIIESKTNQTVKRRFGMGGTGIVFTALKNEEIDLYVEYTGTISEAILKKPRLKSTQDIANSLSKMGLVISKPLGFNNTYALAVSRTFSKTHNLRKISDLIKNIQDYRFAFSYEFMSRSDGFSALSTAYGWPPLNNVKRMDHSLVYNAVQNGQVDILEVYSTDAKLTKLDLVTLEDDRHFFPVYNAVIITSKKLVTRFPSLWNELKKLEGSLDEEKMRVLNARVDIEKMSFSEAVSKFFEVSNSVNVDTHSHAETTLSKIWVRTKEHLFLVCTALLFSILLGVPMGIFASKFKGLGQLVLLFSGLLQTIPSLALLCFFIPLFGIGVYPALVALILYGLLPVVVNTFEGLNGIDKKLIESAQTLSLSPWQRLSLIEVPLASPSILAGIKTAAIISIGTATLAALIGAGGYGAPIVTGLAINDLNTILMGAIPAAFMAIIAHALFEVIRILIIPKGLRL